MDDTNRLLTVKEAADFLGISVVQIYRYAKQEENPIPLIRLSRGTTRVIYKKLLEWVEEQILTQSNK
jgi:excisionase family DNA binding protein